MLVFLSMEVPAQDSIVLNFSSFPEPDSIVIEDLINRNRHILRDTNTFVIHFEDPTETDTSALYMEGVQYFNKVLLYPNPCQGEAKIHFFHALNSSALLEIFDMQGRRVAHANQNLERGMHYYSIRPGPAGMYSCRVSDRKETYSCVLLNTGSAPGSPSIEYLGTRESFTGSSGSRKSVQLSNQDNLFAAIGHMLRFTGFLDQRTEMIYDILEATKDYEFTFPELSSRVDLRLHDTMKNAPDTIRCFAKTNAYLFALDETGEQIVAKDSLVLKPVSYGARNEASYSWEISNPGTWAIDTSYYIEGTLYPVTYKEDTSRIILRDSANELSREFVMMMDPDDFVGPGIPLATIRDENTLDEISGMAASIKNPGCYWVHNDSGDRARIFLINTDGQIVCTLNIDTDYTDNRDWEDIAVGPGPIDNESYIYIGEFGDNGRKYSNKFIFRITEPEINTGNTGQRMNYPVDSVSTIKYDYKDGARDAEILMIDPATRDLYIVTKREENVQIYHLPYPQDYSEEKIILEKSDVTLPFRLTNGGDISADGKEILIKNLTTVYYWKVQEEESILEALSRPGRKLPYIKEPQGEAITWLRDGTGYLTVSEKRDGIIPILYLYLRK